MPSIYVSEAELQALNFCIEQVASDLQCCTDREWATEAENHVDVARSLERKVRKSLSNQRLNKALKARCGQ